MADMDRKTARKYIQAGKLPSETAAPRTWCTREDPFAKDWEEIEALLASTPEFEAKTIFALLMEKYPGRYEPGQLRTLQRHVKRWRAAHGPDKEVVLAQLHRAGEAAQTDFTSTTELGVTIAGAAVRAPAVRGRAAVLQLAVGDGVPVGVDGGASSRGAGGAVPARPRAGVPPDGQLDGGDAPDPGREAGAWPTGASGRSTRSTSR